MEFSYSSSTGGGGGYWTDASSVDALSTCSDAEETESESRNISFNVTLTSNNQKTPISGLALKSHSTYQPPTTAYVIGEQGLRENKDFTQALQDLCINNVVWVDENADFSASEVEPSTGIIVFQQFSGPVFQVLRKKASKLRMYGPPVIVDAARVGGKLPVTRTGYPIFSRLLKQCKVCATGIRSKEDLVEIRRRILYLEGTFLEREGPGMTHLIAARCRGNKYRDAVALDKPILKPEWIDFLWEHKNESSFDINKDMEKYKVRAFYGARIALEGFDISERSGMIKLIEENEGIYVPATDSSVTHIVKNSCLGPFLSSIEESSVLNDSGDEVASTQSPLKRARLESSVVNDANETNVKDKWPDRAKILKAEWFWSSIQIEACADETAYQLENGHNEDTLNNSIGTPNSLCSPGPFSDTDGGTPLSPLSSSVTGRRKRKKLMRELVSSLAQVEQPKCIMEVDEETENLDDLVKSPEQSHDNVDDGELAVIIKRIEKALQSQDLKTKMEASVGKAMKRLNEFAHLVETEKNYVSILMHIVKLFKEPCEANDQKAGRILSPVEIKQIFGPILPIYELHKRILRDMLHTLENYGEESLIGQIYVRNADELRKCYEPFVGYFETVKNEIIRCENENPRFMAFLRITQAKPQCGKEKLVELIIRPVQRLPSTALVLKNLEKNTEKTNPDYEWITKGVEAIDRVNQTINQNKERADARVAIFDVFHEIEGCPVELISDHRTLLKKYDVLALHYDQNAATSANYKNESLTLIVFSDHILIVKRRSFASSRAGGGTLSVANMRSPAVSRKSVMFNSTTVQKRYKFLEWVFFNHIKKVVNVHDSEPRSFAFIVREPEDLRERVLQFTLPEDIEMERIQKIGVVEFFAKQVAQSVQRVDYENFITTVDSSKLNNHGNSSGGFISRGIKKVGRALSLNRTPSKLKRTMSQIINSPFSSRSCHRESKKKDPDSVSQAGSENSFTPIRNHLSTISLFGTKRGSIVDGQATPKTRKTIFEKEGKKAFSAIEES